MSFLLDDQPVVTTKVFTPSQFQTDIFDAIRMTDGNLCASAVAGSGKTTTIVEALERIDPKLSVAFIAFNKSIVEALKLRVPSNVECCTTHSLALKAIMRVCKPNVYPGKLWSLYRKLFKGEQAENDWPLFKQYVGLLKANLAEPTAASIEWVKDSYGLENSIDQEKLAKLFNASIVDWRKEIDFDDFLYVTGMGIVPPIKFDVVFADEIQDFTVAQTKFILASCNRFIGVGDPQQAIYGFRGASFDAFDKIVASTKSVVMPLSISYRCPKAVAREAQKIVPQIECAPSAPDGSVKHITYKAMLGRLASGDMVVSRRNLPIVQLCVALWRDGKRARILGKEIGEELARIPKKFLLTHNPQTLDELMGLVNRTMQAQISALNERGKEIGAELVADKLGVLDTVADECATINEFFDKLDTLFTKDGDSPITLATVHRAKGLEARNVFILAPEDMPSRFAKTKQQLAQEWNIKYIAVTRAMDTLWYVEN